MRIGGGSRVGLVAATALLALVALVGCTSGNSAEPGLVPGPTEPTTTVPTAVAPSQGSATATSGLPVDAISDASPLALALMLVPADAGEIVFTDVAAVKNRLGYGDLTGQAPTHERFEFWELARLDGAMLTGTRLYDWASVMSLDFGWTAEDIAWEIAWTTRADTCTQPTDCAQAAYVLKLRDDLDWNVLLSSLAANGYVESDETPGVFTASKQSVPFEQVRLVPQIHAIAVGDVALPDGGDDEVPPSITDHYDQLVEGLGNPESAYLRPRCVSLEAALGPDARDDDLTAYLGKNDASALQTPGRVAVAINDDSSATVVIEYEDGASAAADVELRETIINHWPSLQTGESFPTVGVAHASVDSTLTIVDIDVADVRRFASMVLTDDAPWALCPAAPTR
jgi:hypothetical protein